MCDSGICRCDATTIRIRPYIGTDELVMEDRKALGLKVFTPNPYLGGIFGVNLEDNYEVVQKAMLEAIRVGDHSTSNTETILPNGSVFARTGLSVIGTPAVLESLLPTAMVGIEPSRRRPSRRRTSSRGSPASSTNTSRPSSTAGCGKQKCSMKRKKPSTAPS